MIIWEELYQLYNELSADTVFQNIPVNKPIYIGYSNEAILYYNAIECDISNAGPSLCKVLFYDKVNFIDKIDKIKDKVERSKLISTSLSQTERNILDLHMKTCISTYILGKYKIFEVIEIIKDGAIFLGDPKESDKRVEALFEAYNIKIKVEKIEWLAIINKCKFIWYNRDNFMIKGIYKNLPIKIKEYFRKLPYKTFDQIIDELSKLRKLYTYESYLINRYNSKYIEEYYRFGDVYLGPNLQITSKMNEICPHSYSEFLRTITSLFMEMK